MAEMETENVMPVELAIQRELSFRKKVASTPLFRSRGFAGEDVEFMPLQGPSSTPSTSAGSKQSSGVSSTSGTSTNLFPASSYQAQHSSHSAPLTSATTPYPNPQLSSVPGLSQALVPHPSYQASSFTNQYPRPRPQPSPYQCPVPFSGPRSTTNFRPPTSGINRLPPPAPHQFQPTYQPRGPRPSHNSYITVDEHGIFFCNVCQVPCTGSVCLKDHLKGHKHKAKLQFYQQSRKHSRGGTQQQQQPQQQQQQATKKCCEVCQIWCTDEENLRMHLRGQKHQAKMQELENGMKSGAQKEVPRPWCELCNIWCIDETSFHLHLKGKKHIANLHAVEGTKRARVQEHRIINLD